MTKHHASDVLQINSIISHLDNPLVSIVQRCLQGTASADILAMSIHVAKQAIAYTCKRESFQLKHQKLESSDARLQRSCDAVLDHTRNIIYLRQGKDRRLFAFSLNDNTWKQLIDCTLLQCTLAFFEGSLLAIGRAETDESPRSNAVYKLLEDEQHKKWELKTLRLPTARGRSTALACKFKNNSILIVAGGEELASNGDPNSKYESLNTVEVFTEQGWQSASSLPGPLCCASGTVVKDNICLLGGWSARDEELLAVYTCQLSELVGTLNTPFIKVWSQVAVAPCPVAQTTITTFQNKLLIMGGSLLGDSNKTPVDEIYMYNEYMNSWDIIGHLPAPRYLCYAQALCKCRFLTIGGCKDTSSASDDVCIFELK